ncbi:Pregnancy-associated plasma protein-A [Geodermatophilus africanus]|uniref:Pregnancy-associated plasma protein-A n=1 Tax=Geodermatophilus africanus TaxID=1137993 RepID=A0A1H3EQY2_9ACTN|nr:zinc metalloprotease [Geodermatophilus africanus]SDX81146.1 Pregnancy-associated plasma protein-A [Geodermatophilus africanus]
MDGATSGAGAVSGGGAGAAPGSQQDTRDPDGRTPSGAGNEESPRRRCATMPVHHRLMAESLEYRQARARIENLTRTFLAQGDATRFPGVAHIPVVVHVVHNTDAQDISDDQVLSQIDVLNRDFRATNPDVSLVPPAFAPLIADSRIEFSLATTDPAGEPTTGITRTRTHKTSFSFDDDVKRTSAGGVDPWPTDRYLNMWVCRLSGGLLGYAQFPGGPADTDGVVVTHSAFGTTGTAAPPFHLGRTATHEVGHYLNLFHIWGDDDSGCGGSDEVDDTPNQGGENTGVPVFPHVTCGNGPNGDLFYDYMDYSDDEVLVMFTHGQAARMEGCLDTVRSSLVQAAPSTPPDPAVAHGGTEQPAAAAGVPSQREQRAPAARR